MSNIQTIEPQQVMKLSAQDFTSRINQAVPKDALVQTPDKKAWGIAISHVEMQLDEVYFGHWSFKMEKVEQIYNEVYGYGTLTVIHPVSGMEIHRSGMAAIQMTQDANSSLADFSTTKKKNALDLTIPKLKAECLKNAAKSLGKYFGRDLNRAVEDTFTPEIIDTAAVESDKFNFTQSIKKALSNPKFPQEKIDGILEYISEDRGVRELEAAYKKVSKLLADAKQA
jgi:hypothetical protein